MRIWLCAAAVLSALVAISCGGPQPHDTGTQVEDATGVHQCKVTKSVERPMLVEWPATEKAALQTNAAQGVIVVRYDGCRLKMLDRCKVSGDYEFMETSRSKDGFTIKDKSELFTKLPLGAVSLEGQINQGNTLSLAYVAVGTRTAQVSEVTADKLSGSCEGATHYIRSMIVGAYELSSEKEVAGNAGVEVGSAGAGGSHEKQSEVLRSDGDLVACVDRATSATDSGCQAIIQLVLDPISMPEPVIPPPVPTPALSPPVATAPSEPSPLPTASVRPDEIQQPGTNLFWLRCPIGQTWNGSSCVGSKRSVSAEELKHACPSGYRLPKTLEFGDLLEGCDRDVRTGGTGRCNSCSASTTCRDMFKSDVGFFWSLFQYSDTKAHAWIVYFGSGKVRAPPRSRHAEVRCIRSRL
jgi:hypothetical protein